MSERLRILHVADKFGVDGSSIHGVSRFLARIFPRFDPERFELRLVGLRPEDGASAELRREGLPVLCLGKGKLDPSTATALRDVVRDWRPHVLHLHGYGATTFGRIVSRWTGVPNVVHEHFVDPAFPRIQGPCDRLLARTTDHAIAVSESVRAFMIGPRHVPAERVELLHCGAPLDEFAPPAGEAVREARDRSGIPEGAPVVGTVGRLAEQKGLEFLLDAAPAVLAEHPETRFLLVGDGPLAEPLQARAESRGVAARVHFAGHAADVAPLMALMDVLAFPSLWEGTPLALFEGMAMGRAIASTDVDGLGEVLRDGATALLVPPRDAGALATALLRLLGDEELRRRLGAAARRDSDRFDVNRTVRRLEEIYLGLGDAASRGRPASARPA